MFNHLKISMLAFALSTTAAFGHEFWIDPLDFTPPDGAPLLADLRVGQDFGGSPFAYLPVNFKFFELAQGAVRVPVLGRLGDRPALNQAPLGDGLNVVLHQTRTYTVKYAELAKFESFLRHKDAVWVLEAHRAAGYPDRDITEVYARYAKSLIAVGDGAGTDQDYGLLTEIVALANPYTDDLSGGFPVRVLYQGAPRADAQVELFAKAADGTVTVTLHRTNAEGVATLPVAPDMEYLVDAVLLRQPDAEIAKATGAQWESLWASLTFAVPGG